MRHAVFSVALFCLTAIAGCSSAPTAPAREPAAGTAILVVGWSLKDQTAIPVRGVIRQGREAVAHFDTKDKPEGKLIDVAPGGYAVEVTHRIAGDRAIAATGLERCDVRPGETVRCEVVVDDREGAEPLPLESSR